jgi:beta-1,4-N-acetylglucosaminyltransferase
LSRIAVILGRGGHTAETLSIVDNLGPGYDYLYLIGILDSLTPNKIKFPGRILPVIPPRLLPQDSKIMSIIRTLITLFLSFIYLLFYRPRIIISCGTGLTVPIFYAARTIGIKTAFIESIARVESLSITGRLLLGKTNLFVVQWQELAARISGTTYGGQLL